MTIKEKRDYLIFYCDRVQVDCEDCCLRQRDWEKPIIIWCNGLRCLNFSTSPEQDLDRAIALIKEEENKKHEVYSVTIQERGAGKRHAMKEVFRNQIMKHSEKMSRAKNPHIYYRAISVRKALELMEEILDDY